MTALRTMTRMLLWLGVGLAGGVAIGLARSLPMLISRHYLTYSSYGLLARHLWICVVGHGVVGIALTAGVILPAVIPRRHATSGRAYAVVGALIAVAAIGFLSWRLGPESAYRSWVALAAIAPLSGTSHAVGLAAVWSFCMGLLLAPIAVTRWRGSGAGRAGKALKVVAASGAILVAALGATTVAFPPPRLNVLLITLDAQRADHLHCYGYHRGTSRNIDALAARGVLFVNASANSSWTLPSIGSIMTGKLPMRHGAVTCHRGLADTERTLAEIMSDSGYRTGGAAASGFVERPYRLTQGFEWFVGDRFKDADAATFFRGYSSPWVTDSGVKFMRRHRGDPFFLWLHYLKPHDPYVYYPEYSYLRSPPQDLPRRVSLPWIMANQDRLTDKQRRELVDLYDGQVNYIDRHVGRVLTELDRLRLTGRTLVILTSDHGEEFGQHGGFGHHSQMYQDELHVPLIMAAPGRIPGGRRVATPVQSIDLLPTVLDLCGIHEQIPATSGHSLTPLLAGTSGYPSTDIVAALSENTVSGHEIMRSIRRGNWRLLLKVPQHETELYNLKSDPGERHNLAGQGLPIERQLALALSAYKSTAPGRGLRLSEDTKKQLRGLGYLP